MDDAGNRLADLLGEETVEKLRQSPLWRAMRELRDDWDTSQSIARNVTASSPGDIEHAQEELISYIRDMVDEIKRDAKVFPQLSNIIENAARMARASFHWERNIGRTRHSAQMRRLVTLADSLSQAAALMQGVDLDEERIVSVSEEESDLSIGFSPRISTPDEEKLAEVHRRLSDLQSQIPGHQGSPIVIDPEVMRSKIENIKHYIRGENNG